MPLIFDPLGRTVTELLGAAPLTKASNVVSRILAAARALPTPSAITRSSRAPRLILVQTAKTPHPAKVSSTIATAATMTSFSRIWLIASIGEMSPSHG